MCNLIELLSYTALVDVDIQLISCINYPTPLHHYHDSIAPFVSLRQACLGYPLRQRRGQQVSAPLSPPSTSARAVASVLAVLLHSGLAWQTPPSLPLPKFRLTFLVCSLR